MREKIKLHIIKKLLEEVSKKYDEALQELGKSYQKSYTQATRDYLTGLYNRYYIEDYILKAIKRYRRSKTPFSIIYIDLDRFKEVNDHFGHQSGDLVLKEVARMFLEEIRDFDTVARIGGDEFLLYIDGIVDESRLESLRVEFEERFLKYHLSFSYGVVKSFEIDDDLDNHIILDHLIALADERMYRSKEAKHSRKHNLASDRNIS